MLVSFRPQFTVALPKLTPPLTPPLPEAQQLKQTLEQEEEEKETTAHHSTKPIKFLQCQYWAPCERRKQEGKEDQRQREREYGYDVVEISPGKKFFARCSIRCSSQQKKEEKSSEHRFELFAIQTPCKTSIDCNQLNNHVSPTSHTHSQLMHAYSSLSLHKIYQFQINKYWSHLSHLPLISQLDML